MQPIKLEVPATRIKFNIGGQIYTMSLADKSMASVTGDLQIIESNEIANQQKMAEMAAQLTKQKDDLHQRAIKAEEAVQNGDAETNAYPYQEMMKDSHELDNKCRQAIYQAEKEANEYAIQHYSPFLDKAFGAGSGTKLFNQLHQSTNALAKLVTEIVIQLKNQTNITDHRTAYLSKIAKLKAVKEEQESEKQRDNNK
ncbi:hypothetical protein [Loigolactobacillus bifermentans]|uniref:Uncharacterized protein n=1 Tax=Loigolactobacillus bifermentans DSM 20003 TaxID=1423726 RepID=A0A0R1GK49_9LACO|nr:hypothetical protein [Loigolactobacillus bifermentans]KRK34379.1 hypothetical protein FC07_GL000587 [Loigolactobacillus bifermentans DSM 20003]QGG60083.1 hypothetical protein LB003_06260 [Loigolactobacillus bifermentans]